MCEISSMTNEALRLAIAEKRGVCIDGASVPGIYLVAEGALTLGRYKKRAWAVKLIFDLVPNWPEDVGAALALCLEIGATMVQKIETDPEVGVFHEYVAQMRADDGHVTHTSEADTPARALAELAAMALGVGE